MTKEFKKAPEIQLIPYKEVDASEARNLYEALYPKRLAHYQNPDWWYGIENQCYATPVFCRADGKLAGHAGVMSVRTSIGSREINALWLVDYSLLPEFQGKGIGVLLDKAIMEMGDLQLGISNERALPVHLKLGWKNKDEVYRYAFLLDPSRIAFERNWTGIRKILAGLFTPLYKAARKIQFKGANKLQLQQIGIVPLTTLNEVFEERAETRLQHRPDWLQWRLKDCPFAHQYFMATNGTTNAILRIGNPESPGRVTLLYINPESGSKEMSNLLKSIIHWGLNNKISVIWGVASSPVLRLGYEEIFGAGSARHFVFHSNDSDIMDALAKNILSIQAIDSDIDLVI